MLRGGPAQSAMPMPRADKRGGRGQCAGRSKPPLLAEPGWTLVEHKPSARRPARGGRLRRPCRGSAGWRDRTHRRGSGHTVHASRPQDQQEPRGSLVNGGTLAAIADQPELNATQEPCPSTRPSSGWRSAAASRSVVGVGPKPRCLPSSVDGLTRNGRRLRPPTPAVIWRWPWPSGGAACRPGHRAQPGEGVGVAGQDDVVVEAGRGWKDSRRGRPGWWSQSSLVRAWQMSRLEHFGLVGSAVAAGARWSPCQLHVGRASQSPQAARLDDARSSHVERRDSRAAA